MSNSLFLSPHDDDQVLFGCFTLQKEKPLVVICTDSYVQANRGENITAIQRAKESEAACKLLGCPVVRLGIRDDVCDAWALKRALARFSGFNGYYAPALQGGNPIHDLVNKIAIELFSPVLMYCTYTKGEWASPGNVKITGDNELKNKALACFTSQINLEATKGHFEAVKDQPEWLV